jgi:hypothetical protein
MPVLYGTGYASDWLAAQGDTGKASATQVLTLAESEPRYSVKQGSQTTK